jgi:3-hydroxyisobutyrate dehydrogenase-like beta-hydroxyacid dehydrogenase/uncharacterized membrane protein YphA (DoxX/SURF4 family)
MLPTAGAVESVIFGEGVAGAFADGCVWAQMGTIGVEPTLRIRDRLAGERPGVLFVDAPVSGSKGPAEQGNLLVLASGPAAAADRVGPVFAIVGRKTVWLGEAGRGSVMKLVVNAYMSVLIEGVAETMELADRFDVGHRQLAECIAGGPLDAPIVDAKLHKMDRGDYGAEFPLEWALKDVDLAIGAAGGQAPPLLAALSVQWHAAVAAGHGRQDISAARLALAGKLAPLPAIAACREAMTREESPVSGRDVESLVLRAALGGTQVAHGISHVRNLDTTAGWLGSIGFKQPRLQAVATAAVEVGAGAALIAGAGTPLAAAAVVGTMAVAARSAHLENGFFITAEGYEYVLNLSAASVALAAIGPGNLSVDRLLGLHDKLTPMQRAGLAAVLGLAGAGAQLAAFWERPKPKPVPAEESGEAA